MLCGVCACVGIIIGAACVLVLVLVVDRQNVTQMEKVNEECATNIFGRNLQNKNIHAHNINEIEISCVPQLSSLLLNAT